MNNWQQFLLENTPPADAPAGTGKGFAAPLTGLGLISLTGEEAAQFLHTQLTNDVEHLGQAEARLAGYCSPKGRLLATFLMWRSADAILLQLPREILPVIQKRLQMFVLRAKVKLADASDSHAVIGLAGTAVAKSLAQYFPALPEQPYAKADHPEAGTLIRLADADGVPRFQWIAAIEQAMKAWPQLIRDAPPADSAAWRLTDIRAGVPQVVQATQEQFVPQMINYEVIGGVNFKKGCYPGQEIVARSQYLGKLKRRMVLATVDAEAKAGMEVFSAADPEQPCGMIVNAEADAAGRYGVLVEMKTAALEIGGIHLGAANGPVLHVEPLPYTLPDAA